MDEVFEFLSGKQLHIKDMFRLGRLKKSQSSSSPPRPLLIKLCTAWDRKLILLRKSKLRDIRIKRLFLREDLLLITNYVNSLWLLPLTNLHCLLPLLTQPIRC